MERDDAIRTIVEAATRIVENISNAVPDDARAEALEWERQQDAGANTRNLPARHDLENFRANRGDQQWRRRPTTR